MDIHVAESQAEYILEKVSSGKYKNENEVVEAAIALLQQQDENIEAEVEKIRREIQLSIEEADRGEFVKFTADETFQRVMERVERKRAASNG